MNQSGEKMCGELLFSTLFLKQKSSVFLTLPLRNDEKSINCYHWADVSFDRIIRPKRTEFSALHGERGLLHGGAQPQLLQLGVAKAVRHRRRASGGGGLTLPMRRRAQKRGRNATRAAAAGGTARGGLESRLVEPRIQLGNGRVRIGQSRVRGFARRVGVGAVASFGLFQRRLGGGQLLGAATL
jgi:hypothetical protein